MNPSPLFPLFMKLLVILCLVSPQSFLYAEIKQPKILAPELAKLETELINETRRAEDIFYKSGVLYDDGAVTAYLDSIADRMAGEEKFADNIKLNVKIIREPTVNAFAMATGSIYVHTGTLARLDNEDQLANLLGHEISHVVNKDTVYFMHSYHKKTIVYKLFDIILAPTSVFFGILGDLTQTAFLLFHVATVTGYSRVDEARSDREGMLWAKRCGYNTQDCAALMQIFLKEGEKYRRGQEMFFLMMHPTTKWRLSQLKSMAVDAGADVKGKGESEEFLKSMTKIKLYNATLNIKWDRFEHARDNIQWVLNKFPGNAEAHFISGEIYRLTAEDKTNLKDELNYKKWFELNKGRKKGELEEEWMRKAAEEYNTAIKYDAGYGDPYRGLALLYIYKKEKEKAMEYLRKYLEVAPGATDKRYVNSLITRLSKTEPKGK